MSADGVTYLDSSALVRLVVSEPESEALTAYLAKRRARASCALARAEVPRAARVNSTAAVPRALALLEDIALVGLDDALLDRAAALGDPVLRTLDAIHVAAAERLGDDLGELITYDRRMAAAASDLGLTVVAPA
ncbi:MAG: type II toxin-antitoxin system VapC family toxin [Thermoleophilaceae bacterium]|nr:type II toxin-antitoxin system VapC family toxin [Thermoleophilaceae bacterium]